MSWLSISNAQTTRSSYSEWLHNYQIGILLETGSMHWSSRADKNHCLLLFRCSHMRPINMVKHQEVQLLRTHTFADKHLLKQCLKTTKKIVLLGWRCKGKKKQSHKVIMWYQRAYVNTFNCSSYHLLGTPYTCDQEMFLTKSKWWVRRS